MAEEEVLAFVRKCCSDDGARLTGVRSAGGATSGVIDAVLLLGALRVEVALSLLGDGVKVLTLVCCRHCDVYVWLCLVVGGKW